MKLRSRQSLLKRLLLVSRKRALFFSAILFFTMAVFFYNGLVKTHYDDRPLAMGAGGNPRLVLSLATVHLYLNSYLKRISNRMSLSNGPVSGVPLIEIQIDQQYLNQLNSDLPMSGKERFYPARVIINKRIYKAEVRYRGGYHWHWAREKKSWRIRLRDRAKLFAKSEFDLIIPKILTPETEFLASSFLNENDVLAPKSKPLQISVNGNYQGLSLWSENIDSNFFTTRDRTPGTLFEIEPEVPNDGRISRAWIEHRYWIEKNIGGDPLKAQETLRKLVGIIQQDDLSRWHQFVSEHMSIKQFSRFFAFDALIGSYHHKVNNHKIYFNPDTQKFEPIVWDTLHWTPSRKLFTASNPLFDKWMMIPQLEQAFLDELRSLVFDREIYRQFYKILVEKHETVAKVIKNSPINYSLRLNGAIRYTRGTVLDYDSEDHRLRHERNLNVLKVQESVMNKALMRNRLKVRGQQSGDVFQLNMICEGYAVCDWREVSVLSDRFPLQLYRDVNFNGKLDKEDEFVRKITGEGRFSLNEKLYPGYHKAKYATPRRDKSHMFHVTGLQYPYLLSGGKVSGVAAFHSRYFGPRKYFREVLEAKPEDSIELSKSLHPWRTHLKTLKQKKHSGSEQSTNDIGAEKK